jgi:hypothetical protein
MGFKILLLAPDLDPSWPEKIRRAVPGVVVKAFRDLKDAADDIADADAAYGTVPPELPARPQNCAGSAPPEPGSAAHGSTTTWSEATSSSPTCAAATTSTLPATPSRSSSPSPTASITTCRRSGWQRGPELIDLPEKTAAKRRSYAQSTRKHFRLVV